MKLNADFSQRVVIKPEDYQWAPSPAAGVERMMLDRVGDEVARATSLVRYAPDSEFPAHEHSGGEEILVLEGEFADEHGTYPAGTYIRNPIGSSHSPRIGSDGCLIFVKLHQFDPGDTVQKVIDTRASEWFPGLVEGLAVMPLHEFQGERVALVRWAPNTRFQRHTHPGGEEILVLEGTFQDEFGRYPRGSWIRNPHFSDHAPFTEADGALIYVKTGHL
ncbi:cupin domain-containing protein [Microbulbifer sp. JSM ZJ756]|uniref:cupin domain-containing protein n=1 Tax=Microbulbifer sp. JSM ZJ756 TaxID=3376191 RepID=UPI0037B96797